jgi:hypothetical protein
MGTERIITKYALRMNAEKSIRPTLKVAVIPTRPGQEHISEINTDIFFAITPNTTAHLYY